MPSYGSNDGCGQQFLSERPSISTYHSPGSRRPPAASSLSSERVEQRYNTLLDAFLTEDRRRRGYIPLDRAVEIYNLYFHSSVGGLTGRELEKFVAEYSSMAQTGATVVDYMELARALKTRDQDFALNIRMKPKTELIRRDLAPPPADEPAVHFPPSPTEAPLSGLGGGGGGSGSSLLQQHHHYPTGSPYDESPAMQRAPAMQRGGGGGSGSGSGYGAGGSGGGSGWGVVREEFADARTTLRRAAEAADNDGSGRLFPAQLLLMCRMHGVSRSREELDVLMQACKAHDGRVDYVAFTKAVQGEKKAQHTTQGRDFSPPFATSASLPNVDPAAGGRAPPPTLHHAHTAPWEPAPMRGGQSALRRAMEHADDVRGRTGRLPASEVKRLCGLYLLQSSSTQVEAAVTRVSMGGGRLRGGGGRRGEEDGVDYSKVLEELGH